MNKNIIIIVLVVLIIGSNAWQQYERIDQTVTMSYMDSELYGLKNSQEELETLLLHFIKGMPAKEMEVLLEREFPDNTRFTKENHINSGTLSFKLDKSGGKVESIGYDPEET
ncbi:MAG: hypothetical protein GY694_21565 [Gammaproteobacteria bacterium]|nr:hypothetical protein [Gammaproteobacteria bacterium]